MGVDTDIIHKDDLYIIEDFECIVCRQLTEEPEQCLKCKKMFCHECIKEWRVKNSKCPIKCSEESMEVGELDPEVYKRYLTIRKLCNRGCDKHYPLGEYLDHITVCQLPDCSPECSNKAKYFYSKYNTCSYDCLVRVHPEVLEDPSLDKDKILAAYPDINLSKSFPVIWDNEKSSSEIQILTINTFSSSSTEHEFHTIVSKVGMLGGAHRFEIDMSPATHFMKIGVTRNPNNPSFRKGFSDFEEGFAIYTLGQTRNDSNGSGMLFGEKLDPNVAHKLVMELNIGEGKMRFKFDGKNHGTAFEEEDLKKGPFYLAFATLKSVEEVKVTLKDAY